MIYTFFLFLKLQKISVQLIIYKNESLAKLQYKLI